MGIGAIILNGNQILLEKRKNAPGKGKWTIPGGLIELGENIEQAVIREVKEETGLEVAEPQLIDVVDHISLGERGKIRYHFVIIDYLIKVKQGKPKAASDAGALKWVPFSEVEEYDLTESFRRFFQKNRNRLEKTSSYF